MRRGGASWVGVARQGKGSREEEVRLNGRVKAVGRDRELRGRRSVDKARRGQGDEW